MTSKIEREFAQFRADNAERWIAVHERIDAHRLISLAIIDAFRVADPEVQELIKMRLRHTLHVFRKAQEHPAAIGELQIVLEGLDVAAAPTKDASQKE